MIRALFFLFKIAILVAIAVWLAELQGAVSFTWVDLAGSETEVNMQLGVFLVAALVVLVVALLLFRIIKGVADMPAAFKRYRRERHKEKGFRALTLGLTAVAAGDTKVAKYQAFRAKKLLNGQGDNGLSLLLSAQSARLEGNENEANENFVKLLQSKDASFLGMRGLLQSALDRHDNKEALSIARKALAMHPRQPW
ncbi:MAG: heme biosynthesis HemY N-terminal domain-containing protein, partial [Alphaproteobacteria bacterium]